MNIAIFPGSFDHFHDGHIYVLVKSLYFFDKVIILVSNNENKKHNYTLEYRKKIILDIIKKNNIKNVVVNINPGKTMDFCKFYNIKYIVRGIRNNLDKKYELELFKKYYNDNSNIHILYFYSAESTKHIHSSLIVGNY